MNPFAFVINTDVLHPTGSGGNPLRGSLPTFTFAVEDSYVLLMRFHETKRSRDVALISSEQLVICSLNLNSVEPFVIDHWWREPNKNTCNARQRRCGHTQSHCAHFSKLKVVIYLELEEVTPKKISCLSLRTAPQKAFNLQHHVKFSCQLKVHRM
jgi:hypothetical protein